MLGEKIGEQKIYISAINGPSLPPKHLKTGVGLLLCRVATPGHSCLGGKRKIEKYVFPSSMALPFFFLFFKLILFIGTEGSAKRCSSSLAHFYLQFRSYIWGSCII